MHSYIPEKKHIIKPLFLQILISFFCSESASEQLEKIFSNNTKRLLMKSTIHLQCSTMSLIYEVFVILPQTSSNSEHDNVQWYHNPRQNIWNKMEKSSKTGQEEKTLVSNFECFLTAIAKV